jgi:hypothetical protein
MRKLIIAIVVVAFVVVCFKSTFVYKCEEVLVENGDILIVKQIGCGNLSEDYPCIKQLSQVSGFKLQNSYRGVDENCETWAIHLFEVYFIIF